MKKSFLIFGAGAVGTYIGASLANQGSDVVFLEREKDLPALQAGGLRLEIAGKIIRPDPVKWISDLRELPGLKVDLGVLALKTYHLPAILPQLVQLQEILPPLLCLQNGVESEGILADALGWEGIIPATVTSAVDRVQKGHAHVRKNRGTGIAGTHPLVSTLLPIFQEAGLNPRHYPRADAMKWSKLLTNLLGNASSAILDLSTGDIFAHGGLYRMELEQIREALRVMQRLAIPPVNLPGVPVNILAAVVRLLPARLSQPLLSRLIGGGRGIKMPSFHIDLYSGREKSEVGMLNGAVVRAGETIGCPTPVNSFLTRTLIALLNGKIPLSKYQGKPELFLEDLRLFREDNRISG